MLRGDDLVPLHLPTLPMPAAMLAAAAAVVSDPSGPFAAISPPSRLTLMRADVDGAAVEIKQEAVELVSAPPSRGSSPVHGRRTPDTRPATPEPVPEVKDEFPPMQRQDAFYGLQGYKELMGEVATTSTVSLRDRVSAASTGWFFFLHFYGFIYLLAYLNHFGPSESCQKLALTFHFLLQGFSFYNSVYLFRSCSSKASFSDQRVASPI